MDVLVVDDDPDIRTALRRTLALEGHTTAFAVDAAGAIRHLQNHAPDLAILDRGLPDMDGLELCRRLRAAGDTLPILVLTARNELADRVDGLDAGADDYLAKPFAIEELLARVRALSRRSTATPPTEDRARRLPVAVTFADVVMDPRTRTARRGSRVLDLTPTEWDLLEYLLRHAGTVLGRERLLRSVWNHDFGGNGNNLEVYVGYLRRKLEADGERRLVHTVRGVGYVARDPPQ